MTETIAIPGWVVALAAAIVAWSVLDRLLIPSTRWFLRRRIHRIVDELNTHLQFQIPSFKLTKRKTLIDRLVSDPKVMQAVDSRAGESGVPREVLREEVKRYAREIVPSFNAYAYFRVGNYLARKTAQLLYRIRLGYADDDALSRIGPNASVVFVMNHRSNMDYLIVAFLASSRTALSYAGRGMGQGLAAPDVDSIARGVLRPSQLAQSPLPTGAGALCADGNGGRGGPSDVPGGRSEPRRPAAAPQARTHQLHGVRIRSRG